MQVGEWVGGSVWRRGAQCPHQQQRIWFATEVSKANKLNHALCCVVLCDAVQYLTRQALAAAGLPTPRNARISRPEDLEPAAQHVGFPSVIKPVSGGFKGAGGGAVLGGG
jgi:phosphoribosylaminoimidazole carboxylase (NCAIR synthetase)